MLGGEKNLDELLYFAQNLMKEIQEKKKQTAEQEQGTNESYSPTRPGKAWTSFKEERNKVLKYKAWKRSFCDDVTSRSQLASNKMFHLNLKMPGSVDKLKEFEAEWESIKKTLQGGSQTACSNALVVTDQSPIMQKSSPNKPEERKSRWAMTTSGFANDGFQKGKNLPKQLYSRSLSQDINNNENSSNENEGGREGRDGNSRSVKKGPTNTSNNNNNTLSRKGSYQQIATTRPKSQGRRAQSPVQQAKEEIPKSKNKTIFGSDSPNKRDSLKQNIPYSVQRTPSTEGGNPSTGTNFSASTINSAHNQLSEESPKVERKPLSTREAFNNGVKPRDERRGRPASVKREASTAKTEETQTGPVVGRINLLARGKNQQELKDKSSRGLNVSSKIDSAWNSEKLIESLKARSKPNDSSRVNNLTNLKDLFPSDSKSSIKLPLPTESSPVKENRKSFSSYVQEEEKQTSQETLKEGNASPSLKSSRYYMAKEKHAPSNVRNSKAMESSTRVENKSARSSSCQPKKNKPSNAYNRSRSPSNNRNKGSNSQCTEDPSKSKVREEVTLKIAQQERKGSEEEKKEEGSQDGDIKVEKEKICKDILQKLQNQKQKFKPKPK